MKKILTPFRVGLLVIVSGAILFIFLTFTKKGTLGADDSVRVFAMFRDASGLGSKSRVQVAGIPVGEVGEIELVGTKARVWLRIKKSVGVRDDATLSKRSESLLGDYLLDLTLGTDEGKPLENGDEIKRVLDAQGMDQVMGTLSAITSDIQQVTMALREVLGGDKGAASIQKIVENLVRLSETIDATVRDSTGQLNTILGNVEQVSTDVRKFTASEEQSLRNIVHNLDQVLADARDITAMVRNATSGGADGGELSQGIANLKGTMEKLDRTIANIEEVTENIKDGKGVIGQLVSDERLGQKIGDTVEDLSNFANRLTGMETEVSVKSDYLVYQDDAKITVGLRLIPKPDKYYLIEIVDDPRGSVDTIYTQTNPPGAGQPVVQKQVITKEAIKFSVQFAKRYSFLTLRFGLIESSGGLGLDLGFPLKFFWYSKWIEDAIVLKVDAFNFSIEAADYPRLRATLRFVPYEHVYINVGMDDILNRQNRDVLTNRLVSGRDFFFGAGVYFTDDDLKSILSITGIPSL